MVSSEMLFITELSRLLAMAMVLESVAFCRLNIFSRREPASES